MLVKMLESYLRMGRFPGSLVYSDGVLLHQIWYLNTMTHGCVDY